MPKLREQFFFEDEALDSAVGMIMTLAAELYITRDRCSILERILAEKGIIDPTEIDTYKPDPVTQANEQFCIPSKHRHARAKSKRNFEDCRFATLPATAP